MASPQALHFNESFNLDYPALYPLDGTGLLTTLTLNEHQRRVKEERAFFLTFQVL